MKQNRIPGLVYGNCFLIENSEAYEKEIAVGAEFLAILNFRIHPFTKQIYLYDVQPVQLTDKKMNIGRPIQARSIALL